MKRFVIALIGLVSFSCAECAPDDEFIIVPKKSVVTSISSLKEECVTESSYALQKLAHINKEIIDQAITIFEGKKLSRTELEAVLNDLAFINKNLENIEKKLYATQKKSIAKK